MIIVSRQVPPIPSVRVYASGMEPEDEVVCVEGIVGVVVEVFDLGFGEGTVVDADGGDEAVEAIGDIRYP